MLSVIPPMEVSMFLIMGHSVRGYMIFGIVVAVFVYELAKKIKAVNGLKGFRMIYVEDKLTIAVLKIL